MNIAKARITLSLPVVFLLALAVAGLLPFDAFAADNWKCADTDGINKILCSITSQFRFLPKLLAVLAYVAAAFIGVKGLLQLKEYGDDPSKVPLQSVLVKLAMAAALISLPLLMQTFITTATGAKDASSQTDVKRFTLGRGVSGK